MKCQVVACHFSEDCGFLDIFKKMPVAYEKCSYARTSDQYEKKHQKQHKILDLKQRRRQRKPKPK